MMRTFLKGVSGPTPGFIGTKRFANLSTGKKCGVLRMSYSLDRRIIRLTEIFAAFTNQRYIDGRRFWLKISGVFLLIGCPHFIRTRSKKRRIMNACLRESLYWEG